MRDERVTKTNPKEKPREGREPKSREYLGARNQRFAIFPGSSLARKGPPAVMAAELVETSRLFARTVAAIDPAWAEQLAGDLVKRSYGEPRWEKRQGSAVADEKVTLYGVPIVPKRRIQLARIDAPQARELFIQHAMVEGDWPYSIERNGLFDFVRANRALRDELGEVEERTRRRDILIDDEAVVEFYDRRVPADVTDVRRFEIWWKAARVEAPELLTMTRDELRRASEPDAELDADAFPSEWVQGEQRMPLRYRFEPGCRRRRGHPRDPARPARPAREPRLRLARAGAPRGARDRPAQDAAEGDPAQRGAGRGLGAATALGESADDSSTLHRVPGRQHPGDHPHRRRADATSTRPASTAHLRMTFTAIDERGRRVAQLEEPGRACSTASPSARARASRR